MAIEHVIVLILENRSFDHIFGARHGVEGLQGTETNPDSRPFDGIPGSPVRVYVEPSNPYVTVPDPPHEYADVCQQLFGSVVVPDPSVATNQGFVIAYGEKAGPNGLVNGAGIARQAMQYFSPPQLPVLNRLADEFVLCDHWFSSVPGPTWPNRLYLHCATSGGLADSPSNPTVVGNVLFGLYKLRTIYESLDGAGKTWRIYYHDPPQSLSLQYVHDRWSTNMRTFDAFSADLQVPGFPNYVVIEPNSGLLSSADGNDMHPSHDVRKGEALIAAIYDALRDSDYWQKSLFVIVFDEHGGFFDHVRPPYEAPHAIPPDDVPSVNPPFRFDRFGLRVPCVLVSPWLPRGYVDKREFDHSSLPATVKKLFGLPSFLGKRDEVANTFETLLLPTVREHTLPSEETQPLPTGGGSAAIDLTLSEHQKALLAMAGSVTAPRPIRAQAEQAVAARRAVYGQVAALAARK